MLSPCHKNPYLVRCFVGKPVHSARLQVGLARMRRRGRGPGRSLDKTCKRRSKSLMGCASRRVALRNDELIGEVRRGGGEGRSFITDRDSPRLACLYKRTDSSTELGSSAMKMKGKLSSDAGVWGAEKCLKQSVSLAMANLGQV